MTEEFVIQDRGTLMLTPIVSKFNTSKKVKIIWGDIVRIMSGSEANDLYNTLQSLGYDTTYIGAEELDEQATFHGGLSSYFNLAPYLNLPRKSI